MQHSSFAVAVVLLISVAVFAQHSSGGSSASSSSSSSSSSGGSHSSYSGGSSSSGGSSGGHSSGGGSYTPSSGSSASRGSSTDSAGSRSTSGSSHSNAVRTIEVGNSRVVVDKGTSRQVAEMKKAGKSPEEIREFVRTRINSNPDLRGAKIRRTEKRGFLSFLRHPLRKPEPKPVADLRHRICLKGPCQVCPAGHNPNGGCSGTYVANNNRYFCSQFGLWSSSACAARATTFLSDCVAERMAMERQARNLQDAESAQHAACSSGTPQECSDMTATSQSENNLYRELQRRYNDCRQRSLTAHPYGRSAFGSYSGWSLTDPLTLDAAYR